MLWAASIVHWGDSSASTAEIVADAHAHSSAMVVAGALNLGSMVAFLVMTVGLVGMIRGRGRTFTIVAATLFAAGCPSHVLGGLWELIGSRLAQAGLSPEDEIKAVESLHHLAGVYFAWIVPFLLGLVLLLGAMWRARVVSWGPLALLLADIVVVGQFTSSSTPSHPLWYVDVVITVVAFAWLGVGIVRYRPEQVPAAADVPIIEPTAALV
jgi:hypothetical protein